jgi:hypothetical protein
VGCVALRFFAQTENPMHRLVVGVALLMLVGCGRTTLNVEEEFVVPIDGKFKLVDAIKKEQTIKVNATSTEGPFSVFIYLEKNRDAAEAEATKKQFTDKTIAYKQGVESVENLEARIPANEAAVVMVWRSSAKASKVKLKITN